ncbi:polyprenol monophosphomannose synthase [Mesonia sp. HuA40]|uniref:polyprenol monophosphomannose synthase n=1 Tax=Mesonia sp. HuA40 TaxID=2602761 RepID=UPI0011C9E8BC|nr:polyprenol monophosphomannose synthase [Mesonia sp. HuA40]TXK71618.1 polyprenol monophosphomannose synthase [Mesonia sp. HuA40]
MSNRLVIIPTYIEAENIGHILEAILRLPLSFDVLVVDDNSPDGTAALVEEKKKLYSDCIHLLSRSGKSGLGTAYIAGFKWALARSYTHIFEMDADFSHNPKDLVRLFNACEENNAQVSIGSRYVTGVNVVNWPMKRILLSYTASKYVKFITGMPIHDTTAGFVCYKREVLTSINLDKIQFIGYAFQIEMKFKAYIKKFKIVEVPVIFTDRERGKSKMNGRIISEAIFGVLKMKFKSLFGKEL